MDINTITHEIIGAGMLESAYDKCFVYELAERGFFVESQLVLPLRYKQITIDAGYRLDVRVERQVIVEVKAVEQLLPVQLVDGITRMILD